MNYRRLYDTLVAYRVSCPADGYTERHHIVPRALGGSNAKSNIVALTAREHFIANVLLAKIHGGTMWVPVIRMKGSRCQEHGGFNSRLYETARVAWAKWSSENQRGEHHWAYGTVGKNLGKKLATSGERHHAFGKPMLPHVKAALVAANTGRKRPDETRKKIAAAQQGEKNHRFGSVVSEERRAELSVMLKGRPASAEQRAHLIRVRTGTKHSEATKAAMSAARKGRKVHPNTSAAVAAANRRRAAK